MSIIDYHLAHRQSRSIMALKVQAALEDGKLEPLHEEQLAAAAAETEMER